MDVPNLDQAIGQITSTLGDPTRRSIYLMAKGADEPLTASIVAKEFGIHPNVARHHLDRLTDEGYLEVTRRRPSGKGGPGAGRPAKCYIATDKEIDLQYPTRRYDLLIDLLIKVIDHLAPDTARQIAMDVGRAFGTELAKRVDSTGGDPMQAIAAVLQDEGFDVEAKDHQILTHHCPFGASSFPNPEVICSLDHGIMSGLATTLEGTDHRFVPHADGGEACISFL